MIQKWEWPLQGTATAVGIFAIGYLAGRYRPLTEKVTSSKKKVGKSVFSEGDPIKDYCVQHSTPLSNVQEKLMSDTLKHKMAIMLGAPEVITLNAALIRALGAKKVGMSI